MGSGLTDLHIKGELPGALSAISRDHLTPQEVAGSNCSGSVREASETRGGPESQF